MRLLLDAYRSYLSGLAELRLADPDELIAVLLIVLLRYKPRGLVPEQLPRIPVPDVPGGRYQPTA